MSLYITRAGGVHMSTGGIDQREYCGCDSIDFFRVW